MSKAGLWFTQRRAQKIYRLYIQLRRSVRVGWDVISLTRFTLSTEGTQVAIFSAPDQHIRVWLSDTCSLVMPLSGAISTASDPGQDKQRAWCIHIATVTVRTWISNQIKQVNYWNRNNVCLTPAAPEFTKCLTANARTCKSETNQITENSGSRYYRVIYIFNSIDQWVTHSWKTQLTTVAPSVRHRCSSVAMPSGGHRDI